MNLLRSAKVLMTLSVVGFLSTEALSFTKTIDQTEQFAVQAICMALFGIGLGTTATIMRTWMWRFGLGVAMMQTTVGIAGLLWAMGAIR